MSAFRSILLASSILLSASAHLHDRQACSEDYHACSPQGASLAALPPVGPELSSFYTDLIQSINTEAKGKNRVGKLAGNLGERDDDSFCCAQNSMCLLLASFNVPFCWDQFTTNYYFPDGSYGSVVAGNFTSSSGIKVNLIYGNFQDPNGTDGNIYTTASAMVPDTSTMPMPTPWTSSGVGSAIPGSMLGSNATITTSASDDQSTTITAITLPSSTISIGTSVCELCNFTIIPGPSGIPPWMSSTISETTAARPSPNVTAPPGTGSVVGTVTGHPKITAIPPLTVNHAEPALVVHLQTVLLFGVGIMIYLLSN